MQSYFFTSLSERLRAFWPEHFFAWPDPELLYAVWCEPIKLENIDNKKLQVSTVVLLDNVIELKLQSLDCISLLIAKANDHSCFSFTAVIDANDQTIRFALSHIPIVVKVAQAILKPVVIENGKYVAKDEPLLVAIANASVTLSLAGDFQIVADHGISIPLCQIGETGILIEAANLRFLDTLYSPAIALEQAKVILPEGFIVPAGTQVILENARISATGFSGDCVVEIPLTFNAQQKKFFAGSQESHVFGIPGGLKHVEIRLENNVLTKFVLQGQILIQYFDVPVDVLFVVNKDGCLSVSILNIGSSPVPLRKEELIVLYLQSLTFDCESQSVVVSGGLELLLFAKDGVQWPRMDVKNLRIDSSGKISIEEAWMDLKEMVNVDLLGFQFELRKIGIGTTQDHKMWVDISGSVKLIEQLPLGLDVEGFRLAWPDDLSFLLDDPQLIQKLQKIEIQFAGVEINFAIPAVVTIDGLIRFFKEAQKVGFAGDMKLAMIPAGFTAEAGLMVGMNFEEPAFPFLYVYFGFEASAGIPLGLTGLALKGAIGLIGMNVAPNKTPEQNWFYDWYKGDPEPGVQHTSKWTDKRNAFAIGVGVTISTADGVVKSTKGILVLAVPGPILVIEGKAILLNPSGEGDGPFEALAVFDGNEGTVQFNVEAQAELVKDMIDAHAGVEAFFDFKDLSNWHLYLGQDEPADRRIQANLMDLMKADAYLMLDMLDADRPQMRMGVNAKIEPLIPDLKVNIGNIKVGIEIDAWLTLEGRGSVSINPEQFSGGLDVDGELTIDALGVHFGISGYVHTNFEGPVPFELKNQLGYTLDLPWPYPDYEGKAEFELKYPGEPKLDVKDPTSSVSLFSRFNSESKRALFESDQPTGRSDRALAESSPVVDVDVNPVISFEQQMNDPSGSAFLRHPDGPKRFDVGKIKFEPRVVSIRIFEKKKNEDWGNGFGSETANNNTHLIYYTGSTTESKILRGVWVAESDVQSPALPATRKLQLLTDNPLINTTHSMGMEGRPFLLGIGAEDHLSQLLLEDFPGLLFEEPENPKRRCVDFNSEDKIMRLEGRLRRVPAGEVLDYAGLQFRSDHDFYFGHLRSKDAYCFGLYFTGSLEIIFPEEIASCSIRYCDFAEPDNIDTPRDRDSELLKRLSTRKRTAKLKSFIRYRSGEESTGGTVVAKYTGDPGTDPLWAGFPLRKEKCFDRIEMNDGALIIESICYLTKSAIEGYNKAKQDLNRNEELANQPMGDRIQPFLNPGCYYKVVVETKLAGTAPAGPSRVELARAFGNQTYKKYTKKAFFQTNAPPANISPYIKWTYPSSDLSRVPGAAEFAVCFKRDYLEDIFDGTADELKNFKINAVVIDAENGQHKYTTTWNHADAFTLYPDEETWEQHKKGRGLPLGSRKEDILKLTRIGDPLLPNQKFNLVLTGGDGGEIFIPSGLDLELLGKYWIPDGWNYDDKLLRPTANGTKMLLSLKNNFENTEISFEVKGAQPFGIIFRYKKTSDNREVYYKVTFVRRGGPGRDILVFSLMDGAHTVQSSRYLLIQEYWPLEWRKFKIKVLGNRIKVFCFDKDLLPADPDGFDLGTLVPPGYANYRVENNIAGSAGLFASHTSIQFRNMQVRNSELMRIPFYTTGFESFTTMVRGLNGSQVLVLTPTLQLTDADCVTFFQQYALVAQARMKLYKAIVDNDYHMARYTDQTPILTAREAVEKYRLEAREAEMRLDEVYNPIALALMGSNYFEPTKKGIEVIGIRDGGNLVALCIKSPEKLFPRVSGQKDPYARLDISVMFGSTMDRLRDILFNADGTQLILRLRPIGITSVSQILKLRLSQTQDFRDDDSSSTFFETGEVKHHRYDRPFFKRGNSDMEVAELTVEFKG